MRWSQRVQEDHLPHLLDTQRSVKGKALASARNKREDEVRGRFTRVGASVRTSTSPTTPGRTTPISQESTVHSGSQRSFPFNRESGIFVGMLQSRRDALALAIACIPLTVDHLVLNANKPAGRYVQASRLTLALFAAAIELFGLQLRTATRSSFQATLVYEDDGRERESYEAMYLNPKVVGNLSALKTLRFGLDQHGRGDGTFSHSSSWQLTSNTITRLELWNHRCHINELTDLLAKCPELTSVLLGDLTVNLSWSSPRGNHVHVHAPFEGRASLIRVAFEVRCLLPMVRIQFRSLKTCTDFYHGEPQISTMGKERFVKSEVLDLREVIDDSKRKRLLKDYESFLPLWEAEQAECTDQRAQARRFGELCGLAMSSRSG